ncbi:MAG: hypothetical protein GY702_19605, partial [Desulfobulbaceae bacterium]|nr:hypothetical protein [Desulfobulbaceae bacterium]
DDEDNEDTTPVPPTKRSKRIKWYLSREDADIFVEFVRNNEVMVDSKHEQYKKPNLVQMLWADICHTLNRTEEHLRGWYKSHKDRLVKLNKEIKKSGAAPQENSEEKWLYDNMHFVLEIQKRNRENVATVGGLKATLKSKSKSKSAKTARSQLPPNPADRPVVLTQSQDGGYRLVKKQDQQQDQQQD